ncbi:hypothetical protein ACHQM5_025976 [Ranunculus cassubicifolius]
MAFRSQSVWRTMASRMGVGTNRTIATSTTPKMKPFAPALDDNLNHTKPRTIKGEFVPMYAAMGSIVLALSFVFITAKQQLAYSPSVHLSKKKRGSFPEFSDPDYAIDESDKFIKKSFFRKVAHLQDVDSPIPNPIRGDLRSRSNQTESLKSVGVDPSTRI